MTPQELKSSILQLAVQGRLVEQRPEEGTAEELYRQIQEEKQRLVKEGKIKKSKKLPQLPEDVIPDEFPDTWKVCYIDDIAFVTKLAGFEYTKYIAPNLSSSGIPLFKGKNVKNSSIDLHFESFVPESISDSLSRSQITKKCLLTPYVGTIGNIAIFDASFKAHLGSNVGKIELFNEKKTYVLEEYVLYYLKSFIGYQELTKYKKATAQESISIDAIRNVIIAIPPLAEQKRIVAKIEELLPYIDRYEKAWSKLEDFNKRFPGDMQKSVLQMAIQGKLVEQRPEEGTGEELYRQIQAEKQSLIKSGKIKKEKLLPEITEDEIPFDIPENWKWVKLGNILSVYGGKRIPAGRKLTDTNTGHIYIRVSDMKNGTVATDNLLFVPNDIYDSISRYIIKMEDVYITVAGTIGRVGKIPPELDGANLTENADRLVFSNINQDWLIQTLDSPLTKMQIAEATTKVGQPKLAIKRIQELHIPLPPLAEQKRIVQKLEEILPLCEKLK